MESISFQYPTWYILFCVLIGGLYALVLYYRDKTFREQSSFLNWGLGAIRFLTVSFLCILLLTPLLKSIVTESKKPVIVLAQDQSESIAVEMDEASRADYQQAIQQLGSNLGEDYELKQYSFGSEVREGIDFNFTDKISNISELLSTIFDLHSNQNLGAVIMATDGIFNEGANPVYSNTKLSVPIYTIALGDTIPKKDLVLKRVFHNRIAYLGDRFSIQVDISAQNCAGNSTTLNVYRVVDNNLNRLQQVPVIIDKNDFFTTQELIIDADQSGVQRFRISVNQIEGEVSTQNNVKDIFVDVLDARQKILVLANSPHPDLTALRQSISKNKNYEISIEYADKFKDNLNDFDFVILHQLPSATNDIAPIISTLRNKTIPHFFVVGNQTNFQSLNQAQSIVRIQADGRNTNEVQAWTNGTFNLFNLQENISQDLVNFAPLTAPFGEFVALGDAQTLLYQRIGKIDTRYPLLIMGEDNKTRVGVLCAEGLWKWRLFDYLQNQNHNIFDELISKTVQYVSLKEDKRKFRVTPGKNIFSENEPVVFDAELYNDSYELINDPDASLTIRSSDNRDFNFTFNKTNQAYTLNAGIFPVGNYTFTGTVVNNGTTLTYDGQFSVEPIQLEIYETTADHIMLRLLSDKYGGALIYPNQIISLADQIKSLKTAKPVIYQTSKNRSVINLKWIFFLLIFLLTMEWFLRRYFGGY